MWIDPFTDWSSASLCTAEDMNRIGGNLNYLIGHDEIKADYTSTDFVKKEEFEKILLYINQLLIYTGLSYDELPTMESTHYNFNLIESLILEIKNRIDGMEINSIAVKFSGEIYSGGSICGGM